MGKKIYEGQGYTLVTGEEKEEKNLYHRSAFGADFLPFIKVILQGREIKSNIQVCIRQTVLTHNYFELLIPSEAFSDKNGYPLQNSKELMGGSFTLQVMQHKNSLSVFEGMIIHVEHLSENKYPYIRLLGKSNSILMDDAPRNRSFENRTLKEIVEAVTSEYKDNRLSFLINPELQEVIPYTVQSSESDYAFLHRLARLYGEYMIHNGVYFIFGRGDQKRVELFEGRDFQKFSLSMEATPQHLQVQHYDLNKDASYTIDSDPLPFHTKGLPNLFHSRAVDSSEKIFAKRHTRMGNPSLFQTSEYTLSAAAYRKKMSNQSLVAVKTETNNPNLRLGDTMQMNAWDKDKQKFTPVESYRIQEIEHIYTTEGYHNRAEGIPIQQTVAPYLDERAFPVMDNQSAVVIENNDTLSLNRLRVKFRWQEGEKEISPWIPLIQGHSGAGMGAHIIPEIGSTVYVEFVSGNAEVPIVLGSLYHGTQKSGYHTEDNDLKVFQTRSGTKRIANDAEGSILEQDVAGSFLKLEGDGNATLNIVKNLNIIVGENLNISVQNNMITTVQNDKENQVLNNQLTTIHNNKIEEINKQYAQRSGEANIQTTSGDLKMRGNGLALFQGGNDVKVSKDSQPVTQESNMMMNSFANSDIQGGSLWKKIYESYPKPYSSKPCDGPYFNQCAIRMSMALIGADISLKGVKNKTNPGGSVYCKHGHVLGAYNLKEFIIDKNLFGKAVTYNGHKDKTVKSKVSKTGILYFEKFEEENNGIIDRRNSYRHIEVWDGKRLLSQFDEQMFDAEIIIFWEIN